MNHAPPKWSVPFVVDEQCWRLWLRNITRPPITKEIASADTGYYNRRTRKGLLNFLRNQEATKAPSWDMECLELVSNHWYIDSRGTPLTMIGAGSICIALVSSRPDFHPLGMEGRIGRVCYAVLDQAANDQLGMLNLLGWAALIISDEKWIPQSMFAFPSLVLAASIASDHKHSLEKPGSSAWINFQSVESLAVQTEQLIESEMEYFEEDRLHTPTRWFVSLDDEQQQFNEWWLICKALKDRLDADQLPATMRVIDRIYSDRYGSLKS